MEGDVIGIVDGYFHQDRAVRHKEILAVMARGVHVLGASSMGALRAAELDAFGMRGVGRVYRAYRASEIEADDEVALVHGPAEGGYHAMSEPLVNIRATLAAAVEAGAGDRRTVDHLLERLRTVPYAQRVYQRFGEIAGTDERSRGELAELGAYCARHRVDVKRDDALLLVDEMARLDASAPAARPAVNRTLFLFMWELGARGCSAQIRENPGPAAFPPGDLEALRVLQIFGGDYPRFHRHVVLRWLAAQRDGGGRPAANTADADADTVDRTADAIAHGTETGVYPAPAEGGDFGFLDRWLTGAERREEALEEQLARFLVRSFEIAPGIAWEDLLIDRLEGGAALERATGVARAAADLYDEVLRHDPRYDHSLLSADRIEAFLREYWGVTDDADAECRAMDRGFGTFGKAVESARPFYLLARHDPRKVEVDLTCMSSS
ncbi:TfuA-like protein [Actinomadura sp. 9N215]|uniref:TfuA-like protein n=1 Tax=Actinomadura sp. 9N215 TaxID=3375150 RepID=UPI0037B5323E